METTETIDPSLSATMIDTHCHLDDEAFRADLPEVLDASRNAGVSAWILIGYAPDRWDHVVDMARDISGMSHSLGVHPSHAREWSPELATRLRTALVSSSAVAVGEFGLDFYRDNAPLEVQREAMIGQLHIARDLEMPAIFHMRGAEDEMLEILEAEPTLPKMVFHSFDGTSRLTDFVINSNAYVGVGGLATRQKSQPLREQLGRIPLESIILETDSPYLVPARQKDRRNVPAQVRTVAAFLAESRGVSIDDIARITTGNAESLFGRLLP